MTFSITLQRDRKTRNPSCHIIRNAIMLYFIHTQNPLATVSVLHTRAHKHTHAHTTPLTNSYKETSFVFSSALSSQQLTTCNLCISVTSLSPANATDISGKLRPVCICHSSPLPRLLYLSFHVSFFVLLRSSRVASSVPFTLCPPPPFVFYSTP